MRWAQLVFFPLAFLFAVAPVAVWAGDAPATPDDAAVRTYVDQVIKNLTAQDYDAFSQQLDYPTLMAAATKGMKVDEKLKATLEAEARKLGYYKELFTDLFFTSAPGYEFKKITMVKNQPHVLVRFHGPRGITNFLELTLSKGPDGKYAIAEMLDFEYNETLSSRMRFNMLLVLGEKNPRAAYALGAADYGVAQNYQAVKKLWEQYEKKDWTNALATYQALPEGVRNYRRIMAYRVRVASTQFQESGFVGDAAMAESEAEFQKLFPRDPSIPWICGWLRRQKKDPAVWVADFAQIEKQVGPDEWKAWAFALDLQSLKFYKEAASLAERATKINPQFRQAYDARLQIAVNERKFDDAVKWVELIQKTFSIPALDLSPPFFKPFRESEEYRKMIERMKLKN